MSVKLKKIGNDSNNKIFVRLNTEPLEQLEQQLGMRFVAQIGILGTKAGGRLSIDNMKVGGKSGKSKVSVVTGDSTLSNADIGLIHEKGSMARNIPRRSFLEVPLTTKMPALMERVGAILLKGIQASNIEEAYKKLAAIGEGVVSRAFSTGGYGMWPDKSSGRIDIAGYGKQTIREGGPSHLIDTGQLRASISSRVVSK